MISEIARKFENAMVAVSFAERGLKDDAMFFLDSGNAEKKRRQPKKRASVTAEEQPRMRL